MTKRCTSHVIGLVLLIVGGLNWGLVGAFDFNLVDKIFGAWPILERVIYILVGVAAVLAPLEGKCRSCKVSGEKK